MGFVTKVDLSYNRQIKERTRTTSTLSGATQFGIPFSALTSGPDYSTEITGSTFYSLNSTFTGTSASTVYTWANPVMSMGEGALSALTPSNSGITQQTDGVYTAYTTTMIDDNLVVLTYSGISFDVSVVGMVELAPNSYSGNVVTSTLYYLSAGTLDYTGRTIWSDNPEITRTDRLIVSRNPTIGDVLTCVDNEGMVGWSPASGATPPIINKYVGKSANYTATTSDYLIDYTSGTSTLTLPTAVAFAGLEFLITNSNTGIITINTTASETISGNASGVLTLVQWDSILVISDGSNWMKIN